MATNIFGAIATNGSTDGALDSIKTSTINDGDIAFVLDSGEIHIAYRYDAANNNITNPESIPTVIVPDDNLSGTGAWILADNSVGLLTIYEGIVMASGKSILWDFVPDNDNTVSGETFTGTAGENLAFGDMVYLKSDGKYWKSDADAAATMPVRAMATGTILADASGTFLKKGIVRNDALTLTVGGNIYASTTAGGQVQTAPSGTGDQVQIIGEANHADYFWFEPDPNLLEIL